MRRLGAGLVLAGALMAEPSDALFWPNEVQALEKHLTQGGVSVRRKAASGLLRLPRAVASRLAVKALGDSDTLVRLAGADAAIALRLEDAGPIVTGWLTSTEPRLRLAAATVLEARPFSGAVAALGRSLADANPTIRSQAADALGASGSREAVPPLLGTLDDPAPEVRRRVVNALSRLGDARAVVPLVSKIEDPEPTVRVAVARALGGFGDRRAVGALTLVLRDANGAVRVAALEALGQLRAEEAVPAIEAQLVAATSRPVRGAALRALGAIGGSAAVAVLMAQLMKTPPHASDGSLVREAVAELEEGAAEPLMGCLSRSSSGGSVDACALALAAVGHSDGAAAVAQALRASRVHPKAALKALAMFEHREQLPIALEYLTSTDPELRHLAREACRVLLDPRLPDGRAVDPLVRALRFAGSSKEELLPLIGLLGRSGSPRAAQPLTVLASGSDDVRIRVASLEALGFLGPAAPSRVLLQGLDDEVGSVRWAAALALRRVGQPGTALPLVHRFEVMPEQDRRVVGVALGGSLRHVTAPRLLARVANLVSTSRSEDRDALIEALGQARDRSAVARLARLAQSLGPADRSKIAEALAGHRSAVRVLEHLASDPVSSVRANATWALGSTGTRAALRPLVRLLKDPSVTVAANAAGALGLIAAQTKSSVGEVLCQALADRRAYVRVNALGALGVAGECCPTEVLALLEHDREEMVRAAAAALVQRQLERFADSATAVLARCAKTDPASSVAVACATPPEPVGDETEPVLVYVIPVAEAEPVAGAPFALVRDDGLVRLGASDRRGAVFERAAPRGQVRLGVAAPFLR